jgi:hypothetical protein
MKQDQTALEELDANTSKSKKKVFAKKSDAAVEFCEQCFDSNDPSQPSRGSKRSAGLATMAHDRPLH